MMSLLVPRKTVGFESPNIAPAMTDSDTDSDGADDSGAMLKKALTVSGTLGVGVLYCFDRRGRVGAKVRKDRRFLRYVLAGSFQTRVRLLSWTCIGYIDKNGMIRYPRAHSE